MYLSKIVDTSSPVDRFCASININLRLAPPRVEAERATIGRRILKYEIKKFTNDVNYTPASGIPMPGDNL